MKQASMIVAAVVVVVVALSGWWVSSVAFDPAVDVARLNNFFVGVAAIGTCFTAIAVAAAFAQVIETKRQLRDNRLWNKMSFALTFLQQDQFERWETALENAIQFISRH